MTIAGAGLHNVDLFVDHEIDEAVNSFFNEYGDVHNVGSRASPCPAVCDNVAPDGNTRGP